MISPRGVMLSVCLAVALALAAHAAPATPDDSTTSMIQPDSADGGRLVALSGALNVRDLGGIAGSSGAIPYNHFIRAANLAHLSPADRQMLYQRDVVLDIDLRTADEDRASPDVLANDPHIRYLPISLLGNQPPAPGKLTSLSAIYLDALDNDQPQFRQVFEAIADAGSGGVIYHCTVGKDRTGMVSAILLELAGVPREQIVHNYAVSAYYLQPMMNTGPISEMVKKQPALAALMGSPPQAITDFLDALDGRYQGAAAYLRTIGISDSNIRRIRNRLAP